jgi:hypothetical protein
MDMARQQEAAADSFPAGDGWMANVLSSPVDGRSSTSTWPTQVSSSVFLHIALFLASEETTLTLCGEDGS